MKRPRFAWLKRAFTLKSSYKTYAVVVFSALGLVACGQAPVEIQVESISVSSEELNSFYKNIMNAPPIMPANTASKEVGCKNVASIPSDATSHLSSQEINYDEYGWEERIPHRANYFDVGADEGKILIIDYAKKGEKLAYRYLSNDNTHDVLYEPWSSSKIFAFTGAVASLRQMGLGAQAKVGDTYLADMITSINSYEEFGTAPSDSNALATFFANIAGRTYLSALFHDEWLKLSNSKVFFRGAYGPSAFEPSSHDWAMLTTQKSASLEAPFAAAQDPAYLAYRCESCGLTGNKPMTTLAQAEWLKRLAVHDRDDATRHPHLTQDDISTLFYGTGHSYPDERFAGMSLGISNMLQHALAEAASSTSEYREYLDNEIATHDTDSKSILDKVSNGQWRVFQKIGWGPSETRSTTENVVLAHVCLPEFQGGREFTIAAQVSVPENKDENLALAGTKMQALLERSLTQYLHGDVSDGK